MSATSGKLSKVSLLAQTFSLTRKSLAELRLKAVRRGVWFRALKHCERTLLDLTIKVVENIHSYQLAKLISRIVDKLWVALESLVHRLMRTKGQFLAQQLAYIAEAWGNKSAKIWAKTQSFVQFLTITVLLP